MDLLSSSILSGIIWDGLKGGLKITMGFLKKKLAAWMLDEDCINLILDALNKAPDYYLKSPKFIEAYFDSQEELMRMLSQTARAGTAQTINDNSGVAVAFNSGSITVNFGLQRDGKGSPPASSPAPSVLCSG